MASCLGLRHPLCRAERQPASRVAELLDLVESGGRGLRCPRPLQAPRTTAAQSRASRRGGIGPSERPAPLRRRPRLRALAEGAALDGTPGGARAGPRLSRRAPTGAATTRTRTKSSPACPWRPLQDRSFPPRMRALFRRAGMRRSSSRLESGPAGARRPAALPGQTLPAVMRARRPRRYRLSVRATAPPRGRGLQVTCLLERPAAA
jgi:hypothetical protein